MRLILIGLGLAMIVGGCSSTTNTANNATETGREPAGLSRTCNPNRFEGAYLDALRRVIADRYGEDFGARCTEVKRPTMGDLRMMSKKECERFQKETGIPAISKVKEKFLYDTEGCAGYRLELCEAAMKRWISEAAQDKKDAEAGK